MPIEIIGKIAVGNIEGFTPVAISSVLQAVHERFLTFHAALFQAMATNTGKVYIGSATMNKLTLEGVAAVLAVPTANSIPSFGISNPLSPAGVDLSVLYLDADFQDEGALLTLLTT